jgi:hypothetical protein
MGWISWLNMPHERNSPATKGAAVVPSDTAALPIPCKTLYSGSGGTLKVLLADDTVAVSFPNVPAGAFLPICAQQVFATGTTCTGMVALT